MILLATIPVSKALDDLRGDFKEFGLENEIRDLEKILRKRPREGKWSRQQ